MDDETRFKFFLAKLFGRPASKASDGGTMRGYAFRGNLYATEFVPTLRPPKPPSTSKKSS